VIFNLGPLTIVALVALGVLLFGPDKLPKMISEAGRLIRTLREFSNSATREIRSELGPQFQDLELQDLNPKAFVRRQWAKHGEELGLTEMEELRHDITQDVSMATAASPVAHADLPDRNTGRAAEATQFPAAQQAPGDRNPT
jgi:sec-independent protein translocase protein TatB